MMPALFAILLLASPALASQEQIHGWSAVTITAPTQLFGDVVVTATADAKTMNVKTVDVKVKGSTITVSPKLIATLPALPLSSLEIRTERGYDPEPWLYVYFQTGAPDAKDSVAVHFEIQGAKLKTVSIDTSDGKGGGKHEVKQVP